ncbi:MAG: NADH-quinone oxidoreductase subunit L [Sandaracinaceae bacterium]|nr:NADH-quinone oxidoreductase subunit L [Sandaracinaceae bacterium]
MEINPNALLVWIVLSPLLSAIILGLFGRGASHRLISGVAVGSVTLSFVLSLYCFITLLQMGERPLIVDTLYEWFRVSVPGGVGGVYEIPVRLRLLMDPLSGIMAVMVSGIAMLIHIYSTEYMGEDPGYRRFMSYLNLFTASMLVLVLASNIPLMFVGWEGVGLCSYLLIGYWWENPDYAKAGRKAFVVNRIGDFGVLLGTLLIVSTVHTFEFYEINRASAELAATPLVVGGREFEVSVATVALFFLFLGCTGKSAQIPLYVWLPDAMAGPTPVSALIHAATMVTAGVYLMCRLSPLLMHSHPAMITIAIVGTATALFAASIGMVQNQLKKVLAYSTVSQLGFMFAGVGVGAFSAGFFHVFTHAFFKACLFLGAGSVMHAVHAHGDADIRYLGGLKKAMPKTHATFLISCLAIAGFPLTSGFFSKDEILLGALESTHHLPPWVGWSVFVGLSLTAFLTAFYMFRLYFRTFWGEFKGGHPPEERQAHHVEPHESGDAITWPLMILAFGALVAGFLGLPHWIPGLNELSWWGHWLEGNAEAPGPVASWAKEDTGEGHGLGFGPLAMAIGTLVGLLGIGVAYLWYVPGQGRTPAELRERFSRLYSLLLDKWRVDELYEQLLVRPFAFVAEVAANLDRLIVDGVLTRLPAWFSYKVMGAFFSRLHSGVVHGHAAAFSAGLLLLLAALTHPHAKIIQVEQLEDTRFRVKAEQGPGYEYRWDFDSDGRFDTPWSSTPDAEHLYQNDAYFGPVLLIEVPPTLSTPKYTIEVEPKAQPEPLPVEELRGMWVDPMRLEGGNPVAPTVQLTDGGSSILFTRGSAAIFFANIDSKQNQITLKVGDTLQMGRTTLRVAARAKITLEVRNLFGNRSRTVHPIAVPINVPLEGITALLTHRRKNG